MGTLFDIITRDDPMFQFFLINFTLFKRTTGLSEFFLTDSYSEDDVCYNEFKSANKNDWAQCCIDNDFIGPNCKGKYFSNDVCFDALEIGFDATKARAGYYLNEAWINCCNDNCKFFWCSTEYCWHLWDDIQKMADSWMLISVITLAAVVGVAVLVFVGCWLRKRSKKYNLGAKKEKEKSDVRGNGAVYLNIHTGGERARSPNVSRSPKRSAARHYDGEGGNSSSPIKAGNHYV